jgi:MYXO-CTERM domain-containing protein
MNLNRILLASLCAAIAGSAAAQTTAAATITQTGFSSGVYSYDIDLQNTGATTLQTFWFSWIPGYNFMPDSPTSVVAPSGWTDTVTGAGSYAIQFKTSGGLAGGSSLDGFQFSSVDSPTTLAGNFNAGGTEVPILTSTVYTGQPLQGSSDQFVVRFSSTPEPASWFAFGGLGLVTLVGRRRRLKAKI